MNQPLQTHARNLRPAGSSLIAVLAFALVPALVAQAPAHAPAAAPSIETLHRNFLSPPNNARPMVRWWWFGPAVVKPEILTELQQMKADGIQGAELAFEYPIVLDDPAKHLVNLPFLSPEMLDDVKYAQEEGRKLGLRIDITLGSGWPYGGATTPLSDAVGALKTVEVPVPVGATSAEIPASTNGRPTMTEGDKVIYAVVANPAAPSAAPTPGFGRGRGPRPPSFDAAGAKPIKFTGTSATLTAADQPRVAVFFISSHTRQMVKRPSVGADGYVVDPLSHKAVADYLDTTGKALISAFAGDPPTAIFSDSLEIYGSNWTPTLPAEFLKRRGYDLMPHLPELVAGGSPAAETVRHDYGRTMTEMIDDNYLRQVTAWAEAHHTKFRSQTYGEPAVSFSSQVLANLPEGEGPQWRSFSTLRWATSANHVYGNPVTSGETFTWLHSPVFRAVPLDMKVEADIDFIMGENQIICHGWPYSPPDDEVPEPGWSLYAAAVFNNHNPWHPVMPAVTAYIGRMSYLMRQGQPANQVAVLLPTDDAWASFSPASTSVTADMQRLVPPALMSAILSAGYNVDFIDADAIDKVGLGTHQILVIPPTDRIPVETLRKLAAFTKSGGKVISVGRAPSIDPEGKPLAASFASLVPGSVSVGDDASLPAALTNAVKPDFQLPDADATVRAQLGFIRRKLSDADIYFVANTSNRPIDTIASFATAHRFAEEWNTDTGIASPAAAHSQAIHLDPYESRVFVFSDTPSSAKPAPVFDATPSSVNISTVWKVTFPGIHKTVTEPNLTDWTADPSTLHYSGEAIYSRDVNIASPPKSTIFLEVTGGKPLPGPLPTAHLYAVYDAPIREAAQVFLNGQFAGTLWHPPYNLDVTKFLKPGMNHIEIHVYNTALNAWSALPPRNYGPLIAKYGDRFQMQDLNQVKPISSGLLGEIRLVAAEAK